MMRPSVRTPSTSMATILIPLHFLSMSAAGPFLDRKLLLDYPVESHHLPEQVFEAIQFQLAGRVGKRARRVWVRFDEKSVDPHSRSSPGEREDELGLAARDRRSEERRVGKECRSRWSPY